WLPPPSCTSCACCWRWCRDRCWRGSMAGRGRKRTAAPSAVAGCWCCSARAAA
ncbi:MAG: hypothetical protein AVDCRST_MAG51-400, partial [uncultured Ramlibacter sp.]